MREVEWEKQLEAAGVVGTFVLIDVKTGKLRCANPVRAALRYSPASTFKIPNSIIALETGVVNGAGTVMQWDGLDRGLAAWNRSQTLREAYEGSTVWAYQQIARKVGLKRMREFVRRFRYGNQLTGAAVDQFWLNGALTISAREQAEFLGRLWAGKLELSERSWPRAKAVWIEEDKPAYKLYSKTGWDGVVSLPEARFLGFVPPEKRGGSPQVGWYVGVVENANGFWPFALNLDLQRSEDVAKRKTLARAILGFLT